MPKGSGNIYQTARKAAGLTQEAAAERLAVSDTSIRAYESGERLPGDDVEIAGELGDIVQAALALQYAEEV